MTCVRQKGVENCEVGVDEMLTDVKELCKDPTVCEGNRVLNCDIEKQFFRMVTGV